MTLKWNFYWKVDPFDRNIVGLSWCWSFRSYFYPHLRVTRHRLAPSSIQQTVISSLELFLSPLERTCPSCTAVGACLASPARAHVHFKFQIRRGYNVWWVRQSAKIKGNLKVRRKWKKGNSYKGHIRANFGVINLKSQLRAWVRSTYCATNVDRPPANSRTCCQGVTSYRI